MQEDRSRRAFLRVERPAQQDECHISSLLVHVRPERQQEIADRIAGLPGIELAPSPKPGRLIVTLETANTFEIMDPLVAMAGTPVRVAVGERRGALGGCGGDSGAPAFDLRTGAPFLVGIVFGGYFCGGRTSVTAVHPYREWISDTAQRLGAVLGP